MSVSSDMYPFGPFGIPMYFAMWATAFALSLFFVLRMPPLETGQARRKPTAEKTRLLVVLVALSLLLMGGAKLLYLTESLLRPFDDYVPQAHRGIGHGFRIPGGVLLLAVAGPFAIEALGFTWKTLGDRLIFTLPLTLVVIRLGCLLNGCCFGATTDLPWSLTFPRESWAFWFHVSRGWLEPAAPESLPVHPLQIYFMLSALLVGLMILALRMFRPPAGTLIFACYTGFFATTAAIESLRANFLTLNNLVSPASAFVFFIATVRLQLCSRRKPAVA